jgi:hypothetical protein
MAARIPRQSFLAGELRAIMEIKGDKPINGECLEDPSLMAIIETIAPRN